MKALTDRGTFTHPPTREQYNRFNTFIVHLATNILTTLPRALMQSVSGLGFARHVDVTALCVRVRA